MRLGWRSVDNPGVNEALTNEVIHSWVQIKTVQISGDAAALILKHANISLLLKLRHYVQFIMRQIVKVSHLIGDLNAGGGGGAHTWGARHSATEAVSLGE